MEAESHSVADHWVKGVIRFRWPVIAGVVAILGVMAIPAASMNLGIPTGATANQDTAARQSYEAISRGFGEGFNGPLLITAEPTGPAGRVTPELTAKLIGEFQDRDDIVLAAPVGVTRPATSPCSTSVASLEVLTTRRLSLVIEHGEQLVPLDVEVWQQAVEPAGQPPCSLVEDGHERRDERQPDDEGVDEDRSLLAASAPPGDFRTVQITLGERQVPASGLVQAQRLHPASVTKPSAFRPATTPPRQPTPRPS